MIEFRGRELDVVTLDFETFFEKGYTLTSMPTSAYVRDKRFLAQMVGIKINDAPTTIYTYKEIRDAIRSINWSRSMLLCHNTAFDGFIITQRYKVKPAGYLDTLSMARAVLGHGVKHKLDNVGKLLGLGGKQGSDSLVKAKGIRMLPPELLEPMGAYCTRDVDLCAKVFEQLYTYFPDDELELVDMTLRMFCEPVFHLDKDLIAEELEAEIGGKMRALLLAGVRKEDVLSNAKFMAAVQREGGYVAQKISKATGRYAPALAKTDEGLKQLLRSDKPKVRALAEARVTVKSTIGETRAQRFLDTAAQGRMPVLLNYYGAHTGRWSGGDKMNMQNLPRPDYLADGKTQDPATGRLRRSLRAPKGKQIVVADSGQIEARMNAWLAGQHDVLDIFRAYDAKTGPDLYRVMAAALFNVPLDQVTKHQRFIGKVVTLACWEGDTPVLTTRGAVPIRDILHTDKVWDGVEWVSHEGVAERGIKTTELAHSVAATPDHEILTEHGWQTWHAVHTDPSRFQSALNSASSPFFDGNDTQPPQVKAGDITPFANVAAALKAPSPAGIWQQGEARAAITAQNAQLEAQRNSTGNTKLSAPTNITGAGYSIASPAVFSAVTMQKTNSTRATAFAESPSTSRGVTTVQHFWPTCSSFPVGTTPSSSSTARTSMADTPPETYDLSLVDKMPETVGPWLDSNNVFENSKRSSMTYDLLNCGPRNRFTILTDRGPIIVHNCGYGMGANKLIDTLANAKPTPVIATHEQAAEWIDTYRRVNNRIKRSWKTYQSLLPRMTLATCSVPLGPLTLVHEAVRLPNGLFIRYPGLKVSEGDWENSIGEASFSGRNGVRSKLYGGLLCENFVQALSRCIIAEQMLTLHREGIRILTSTHDEIVALSTNYRAERTYRRMIEVMSTPPEWAMGLPLAAEGGFAENYSK